MKTLAFLRDHSLPTRRAAEQAGARTVLLLLIGFVLGAGVVGFGLYLTTGTRSATNAVVPTTAGELSASTRAVLSRLDASVDIQFYSLLPDGRASSDLREFTGRVDELVAAFKQAAGDKLSVSFYQELSAANTRSASAAGVLPFNLDGDPAYLGLVVRQHGRQEALAQIRPEWEPALEFDLARAISRVANTPAPPVSPADTALAEKAAEDVQRSIPNVASVSLEDGKRILREAALKEYKTAVAEMENETKQAQQRLLKAEAANSDSDRQAALEQLRQVQSKHTDKLNEIATRSQAQLETWQRLKQQ